MANLAYANFKIGENLYASFGFTGDYYAIPSEETHGAVELTIRGYGDTYNSIPEAYDYYYDKEGPPIGVQYWGTCIRFFWNWNEGGTLVLPDGMTTVCDGFLPPFGVKYTNQWYEQTFLDKIVLPNSFERITCPVSGAKHVVGGNIRYVGLGADGNTYGSYFDHTYLESITLRDDCYIADGAFNGCLKLSKINNSNSLGGRVGTHSFCDCISLTRLNILESLIIDTSGMWGSPNYGVFWISDRYEPVVTTVTGKQSIILAYYWERDRRRIIGDIRYSLHFQNHNAQWVGIDMESYSYGQVKISPDGVFKTCRLTDDINRKYTGLCVAVDKKWYQFRDKKWYQFRDKLN